MPWKLTREPGRSGISAETRISSATPFHAGALCPQAGPPHRPGDDLAQVGPVRVPGGDLPDLGEQAVGPRGRPQPEREQMAVAHGERSAILAADGAGFRGPTGFARRCRAHISPLPGDWRAYWLFADVSAQTWRMSVKPAPVRWLDLGAGG